LLPQEAAFLTSVVVIPAVMYVLYRTIVPFEPVMRDFEVGAALMFPLLAGAAIGFVHILIDPPLLATVWGLVAYLFLYPVIASYAVLILFNRRRTLEQPAAPIYFAVGGAGLAMGLAAAESYRSFASLGDAPADLGFILVMLVQSTAFVMFHCSKGLYLGTHVAQGRRSRGVVMASLLEGPLGLLYFTARLGDDRGAAALLLLLYSLFVYLWVWRRFFPEQMPEEMAKALKRERRRARLKRARGGPS